MFLNPCLIFGTKILYLVLIHIIRMDIQKVIEIAKAAGAKILEIYDDPGLSTSVDYKADQSPLTLADTASHQVIMDGLIKMEPDIPIISEEGKDISFELRQNWDPFWLVDPLDGTKEFIKRNGEFTVNIALIHDKRPVLGVIYAPVKNVVYYGSSQKGAFMHDGDQAISIKVNSKKGERIAVRSRSHSNPMEEEVLERYGVVDSVSVGSSLKFCLVAEGESRYLLPARSNYGMGHCGWAGNCIGCGGYGTARYLRH